MKNKTDKGQLNNKGFSLLELLVAVAILAVIVTPFLMAFLTTTRINASTKEQQRAKFAATNVMEDIRSVDAEAIIADTEHTQAIVDEDGTTYYLYTTTQTTDGEDYTVEAILDPRITTEDEDDESTDYNAERMAHIYGMNSAYDAFYELDAATDNSKIEQLAEILLGNRDEETLQSVYDSVNREIILHISTNEKGGTDVSVRAVYTMPSGATINTVSTSEQVVYTDSNPDNALRGVYLFYNPLYNGSSRQAKETITVVNDKGIECDVYLVKQNWPSDASTDAYKDFPFFKYCRYDDNDMRNSNYLVNVRLKEPTRSDTEIVSEDGVNVMTTIRTNIDDLSDTNKLSQYERFSSDNVLNARLKLTYSNSGDNYAFVKTITGKDYTAGKLMGITDLSGIKASDNVYHVTVKAYKGIGDNKESEAKSVLKATTQ